MYTFCLPRIKIHKLYLKNLFCTIKALLDFSNYCAKKYFTVNQFFIFLYNYIGNFADYILKSPNRESNSGSPVYKTDALLLSYWGSLGGETVSCKINKEGISYNFCIKYNLYNLI